MTKIKKRKTKNGIHLLDIDLADFYDESKEKSSTDWGSIDALRQQEIRDCTRRKELPSGMIPSGSK